MSTIQRIRSLVSPKHLAYYARCPRKFQMKYLRNVKPKWRFSEPLTIGWATHNALAEVFRNARDGEPIASYESYASEQLSSMRYPTEGATELRAEHLPIVVSHMETAVATLPRQNELVHVEKTFTCPVPVGVISEEARFSARPDLIIRNSSTGSFDHIDFKTGTPSEDTYQNVVTRIAVASELGLRGAQLRTVNLFTKVGEYRVIPSAKEDFQLIWPSIRETVVELANDRVWSPVSDPAVCRWCEYNRDCDAAATDPDGQYDA